MKLVLMLHVLKWINIFIILLRIFVLLCHMPFKALLCHDMMLSLRFTDFTERETSILMLHVLKWIHIFYSPNYCIFSRCYVICPMPSKALLFVNMLCLRFTDLTESETSIVMLHALLNEFIFRKLLTSFRLIMSFFLQKSA